MPRERMPWEPDPALLFGFPVVTSPVLPMEPAPGQDARRIVRHGLKDRLPWLDIEVGPQPGAKLHAVLLGGGTPVLIVDSKERLTDGS